MAALPGRSYKGRARQERNVSSARRIRLRTSTRSIDERHRASSGLELLFGLTYVVSVSAVTTQFGQSVAGPSSDQR
jgi:hypothetical protein